MCKRFIPSQKDRSQSYCTTLLGFGPRIKLCTPIWHFIASLMNTNVKDDRNDIWRKILLKSFISDSTIIKHAHQFRALRLLSHRFKHCQRHNGPEDWVHLTKVTSWGHITNSNTNLDQISSSESRPSINFKISTKHQHLD